MTLARRGCDAHLAGGGLVKSGGGSYRATSNPIRPVDVALLRQHNKKRRGELQVPSRPQSLLAAPGSRWIQGLGKERLSRLNAQSVEAGNAVDGSFTDWRPANRWPTRWIWSTQLTLVDHAGGIQVRKISQTMASDGSPDRVRTFDQFYEALTLSDSGPDGTHRLANRPFWSKKTLRRAVYGLPHLYRFGVSHERSLLMSTFLGVQYLVGAIAGTAIIATLFAIRPKPFSLNQILVLTGLVGLTIPFSIYLLGGIKSIRTNSMPRTPRPIWLYHVLLNAGGCIILGFAWRLGSSGVGAGMFLVWGAAYSFTFFSNWIAMVYVTLSLALFVMIVNINHVLNSYIDWIFVVAGVYFMGISVGVLVTREFSFRMSAELLLNALSSSESVEDAANAGTRPGRSFNGITLRYRASQLATDSNNLPLDTMPQHIDPFGSSDAHGSEETDA
jgi:hypothetical protein